LHFHLFDLEAPPPTVEKMAFIKNEAVFIEASLQILQSAWHRSDTSPMLLGRLLMAIVNADSS